MCSIRWAANAGAGTVKNEDKAPGCPPAELPAQAVFQIGDTTIIAIAHYQEDGKSCTERLVNILREEVEKQ